MANIVILSGPDTGKALELTSSPVVIGRGCDCGLVLVDPAVSSRHVQLRMLDEDTVELLDLTSTNGTWVNGDRLLRGSLLRGYGEFQVGTSMLRFTGRPGRSTSIGSTPSPPTAQLPASPPVPPPAANGTSLNAGAIAGQTVRVQDSHVIGGNYYEGLRIRSKMRPSARRLVIGGLMAMLVGLGLFGYFVLQWNGHIFDMLSSVQTAEQAESQFADLPSPYPWLPLGCGLIFSGLVLAVIGLCVPRDKVTERIPPKRRR